MPRARAKHRAGKQYRHRCAAPRPRTWCGNAAAQELKAHGFELYYFNSKKQGELDFVIEYQGNVLPLEIKSGKAYTRHNALDNVLKDERYAIPQALVFCNENISTVDKIVYLPIYMIGFLENEKIDEYIYSIDLSALQ